MDEISWAINRDKVESAVSDFINLPVDQEMEDTANYFCKFELYRPTPLYKLDSLSLKLGVEGIYIKDESVRFGLKAFKVLGGFYAVSECLAEKLGKKLSSTAFEELRSEKTADTIGDITFACATDGNHGLGVAWTASQLGYKAVVYLPAGSSRKRVESIAAQGAKVIVTDKNYDDTVRIAVNDAVKNGWCIIQDTVWEGYEKIPFSILRGYSVIGWEISRQIMEYGLSKPTHIFIQAGVGTLAAAIIRFFTAVFPEAPPIMAIVEPKTADCIYKSVKTGKLTGVGGDLNTIMAGLACGEPNPDAWKIIRSYCSAVFSVPDSIAEKGMRIYANPLNGDKRIISGESGAVTLGLAAELLENDSYAAIRNALQINQHSNILLINTEGDTDPDSYAKVVERKS